MTDPRSRQDWELLFDRYLAGELSRAEETEFLRGLAERGGDRWAADALRACRDRATAATLRTIGQLPVTGNPAADLEGAARLERALKLGEAPIDPQVTRPRTLSFFRPGAPGRARDTWPRGVGAAHRPWARSLASVAVAAMVAIGVGLVTRRVATTRAASQAFREFVTAPGGRITVTLRDGTRLMLGPASHLRVPRDFGMATRTVELSGEAVFAVVHDAARPFAVRTAITTVHDVGTVFAVRAYNDEASEQVAVQDGVVSLGAVVLHARDVATVGSAGDVAVRTVGDVAPYLAWSQGRLAFSGTRLSDAAREIGRTYDLDITVADSILAAKLITASFTDQPVDIVLDDITAIVGAQYHRVGRMVTIRRGARGAAQPRPALHLPTQTALTASSRE